MTFWEKVRKAWKELGWNWRQRRLWLDRQALERTAKAIVSRSRYDSVMRLTTAEMVEQDVRRLWSLPDSDPRKRDSLFWREYVEQAGMNRRWAITLHSLVRRLARPGAFIVVVTKDGDSPDSHIKVSEWATLAYGARSADINRSTARILGRDLWFIVNGNTYCPDIDRAAEKVCEILQAQGK